MSNDTSYTGFETPQGKPMLDSLSVLREAAQSRRRYLDHVVARQAEIDAKPDAQPWEVEHARRTVVEATAAVERYAVALAVEGSGQ